MKRPLQSGFTLIELMMVAAIIAILAALAYPTFTDQLRKSRRADGYDILTNVQLEEEKWRANNATYTADLTNLGYGAATNQPSNDGYYKVAVTNNAATTYTLTATAQDDQANDTGCTSLTVDQDGTQAPAKCW